MKRHPYQNLPAHALWRSAVAEPADGEVDPVVAAPFRIQPTDKVATAGSCFAQHISRTLRVAGYTPLQTEPAHPVAPPDVALRNNYGVFSARYGNIYTPRQLLQLILRAFGEFEPEEPAWRREDGAWVDPFRPQIQPCGFLSLRELELDRQRHLACVRNMFETLDVLIFTFGLTECWVARADGAAFPLCPGVAGGTFDEERYEFVNFDVADVVADMLTALDRLWRISPAARVILTVSPVPLVATAEPRHVLTSTVYSKSVLRVASEMIIKKRNNVVYFPSYEIIAGPHGAGRYYAHDLRSVTEAGVAHVMRVFLRHFTEGDVEDVGPHAPAAKPGHGLPNMQETVDAVCDELALDQG